MPAAWSACVEPDALGESLSIQGNCRQKGSSLAGHVAAANKVSCSAKM